MVFKLREVRPRSQMWKSKIGVVSGVTWDQARFSFRFENYIRAGKAIFLAVRENAWEPLKLGLISGYKRNHKHAGIGVRRIRTFPFLPTPLTFRLWSSENQIVRIGSRSRRRNQSRCTFSRFVICLVLPLLLPTLTIWFSLHHKRNLSGIERCFH